LRDGFNAMVKDPDFIAEMNRIELDLDPLPGEVLQKTAADILDIPPEVKNRAKTIFGR
jgi:hypothetical protein